MEVVKVLGRAPSELARDLDSRDWAYFRLTWDRHGSLEHLMVKSNNDG